MLAVKAVYRVTVRATARTLRCVGCPRRQAALVSAQAHTDGCHNVAARNAATFNGATCYGATRIGITRNDSFCLGSGSQDISCATAPDVPGLFVQQVWALGEGQPERAEKLCPQPRLSIPDSWASPRHLRCSAWSLSAGIQCHAVQCCKGCHRMLAKSESLYLREVARNQLARLGASALRG